MLAALLAAVAIPASAQTLVIGNKGEDTVSFVDLATGKERARVATARMPHEVAISPDGRRAAVVAYGGNSIDVFDVATARRLERIDLGANRRPHGLVWLADNRLIATCEGSDTLAVVLANAPGAPDRVYAIPTAQKGSHMLAVHRGDTAYVANIAAGTVSVIDLDGQRPVRVIPAGKAPEGIALSPDGRQLWVADRDGAAVRLFNTTTLSQLAQVAVGPTPIRVLVSPDGRSAVTSNYGDGTLSVIDTRSRKVSRTVRVSGGQAAAQVTILFARDGRRLFVAETGTDTVAEVDLSSGRVLRRLPAGDAGDGLGYSSIRSAK
jgi:YVTN family beta-propeller protein